MNILFVCTGNTCRSPRAAALMQRRMEREGVPGTAESAGLAADGGPASSGAQAALAEWGLDLSGHRSRQVTAALCARADLVAAMSPHHAQALRAMGVSSNKLVVLAEGTGGIPDPFGGDLAVYRRTRDALEQAIQALPIR